MIVIMIGNRNKIPNPVQIVKSLFGVRVGYV